MAFDFPASPTIGETYTHAPSGAIYNWDGKLWAPGAGAAAVNPYVLRAGDTMTGALLLPDPDPVVPKEATHKKYVDRLIAEMSLYQGTWQVAANIPNLNIPPNAPLNGYSWTAQTSDPNTPEMAPLTIPGIGGRMIAALDTIRYSEALTAYEHIQGPVSVSQMVIADTPPAGAFHGQGWWDSDSGKQYVYYIDVSGSPGAWVQMSGGGGSALPEAPDDGTLYGRQSPTAGTLPVWAPVITSATIVSDTAPATAGVGQMWWNNSTGNLSIWTGAEWVQANVEEAPVDGQVYGRSNADWAISSGGAGGAFLPLTGGDVTGQIRTTAGGKFKFQATVYPTGAGGQTAFVCTNAGFDDPMAWIQYVETTSNASMEFWTSNGAANSNWAFKTAIGSPPGIVVNGDCSVGSITDRTLLADPELAQFVRGEGDERGVDLGQVVKHLMAEIKALKAAR